MAIVSLDGHYLRVNRCAVPHLGRSEADPLGRRLSEIVHPDDFATAHRQMDGARPRGSVPRIPGTSTLRASRREHRVDGPRLLADP